MERGENRNLAMLCNSCSSGGGEVNQPTVEDMERHGRICFDVSGKLATAILMEHSSMLGYLKEMAKTDKYVADFIKDFI